MNEAYEKMREETRFSKKYFFDEYVKYLKSLDLSNKPSERVSFFSLKRMRTTPLMSRLNYSISNEKLFIDSLIIEVGYAEIVVIYGLPAKYADISDQCGSWTMTALKRDGYFAMQQIDEDRRCRKMHWDDTTWLNVWGIPLNIRAVTIADKDFRKEYEGGYLVYEGNQYGDTSDFYVIGSLERKNK